MTLILDETGFLIAIAGVFFVAGIMKGVMGFGLPIISMSLLPFFMPVEKAIVVSAFVQPFTNLYQLLTSGPIKKAISVSMPVLMSLALGVLVGAYFFSELEASSLLIVVGMTISGFALVELFGKPIFIPEHRRILAGNGFGLAAGLVGSLTSLNGWAFIMYLLGCGYDRQTFRSAIALMFIVSGLLISSSFLLLGKLDWTLAIYGLFALATAFPGMWIGNRIGSTLPQALFRKVVLVSLAVIGAVIILRALQV